MIAKYGGLGKDANGDGAVDIQDYITLQKYILDPTVPIKAENVDLNNDTRVNSADLFLLKKKVNPMTIIFGMFAVGILGYMGGFLK